MIKVLKRLFIIGIFTLVLVLTGCLETKTTYLETPRFNQVNIHAGLERGSIQLFVGAKNNETVINYAVTDANTKQLTKEEFETSSSVINKGNAKGVLFKLVDGLADETYYNVFVSLSLNEFESDILMFPVKTVSEIETLIKGTGTEEDPFLISEAWQLAEITTGNFGYIDTAHYQLVNDIDLSEYENWIPIGKQNGANKKFNGVFNGNGYTISNLTIKSTAGVEKWGLFQELNFDGLIINLKLDKVDITVDGFRVGALVGYAKGTIHQVHVTNANITQPSGEGQIGGIIGSFYDSGSISQSSYQGNVTASGRRVGGIVGAATTNQGYDRISLSDLLFIGEVKTVDATGRQVGGILGAGTGVSVNAVVVKGNVSGVRQIGGVLGYIENNVGVPTHVRNLVFLGDKVEAVGGDGNTTIGVGYILGDGSFTRGDYVYELGFAHDSIEGANNNSSSRAQNGTIAKLEELKTVEYYNQNIIRFNFETVWQMSNGEISLRRIG
ncbi:hypothetical protein [Acholeplasma granularum]|uniref:hypothetical protein n=1 Tax=Acholeplasma granularum TaxID=264635 RepID=UPI00046E7E7B|nr:hypothetical protein [Acholeplasma granularum]